MVKRYQTDTGRVYAYLPVSFVAVNLTAGQTQLSLTELVPASLGDRYLEDWEAPCSVGGLTPRLLVLFTFDEVEYRLGCPVPFSEQIKGDLQANSLIKAWEFQGEAIRHSRLKKWR